MKFSQQIRRKKAPFPKTQQGGYVLIAVLFALTLAIIAMAATAPRLATQIRRQREQELVERGNQYKRAIQLYYRKFGRYPMSLEQLENTNEIRFLRRRYTDPITGKDEWRIIRLGQAKPKKIPNYMKGAQPAGQAAANLANPEGESQPGTAASQLTQPGASGAQPTAAGGATSTAGAPIVGVASTSKKESLIEFEGQTHYNDWEFTYDPALDPLLRQGMTPGAGQTNGGTPAGQTNPNGPGSQPQPAAQPQNPQ